MKNLIVLLSVASIAFSCFSSQGLPVKQVENNAEKPAPQKKRDTDIAPYKTSTKSDLDHSEWNTLLKKYVTKNGDVNYKGFKNESEKLNTYVSYLEHQIPTEAWSVNKQLAYFINVYNANTIKLIIDNYPLKSIKDISSPWKKDRFKIGDKDFSLAGLENGILRTMNEPRIHFAINCASTSCPKLLSEAYTEANVLELMEKATKEFINNSAKNELSSNKVKISEIFKWYKSDFTENGSVIDYINLYSTIKINAETSVDYIDYDWSLNAQN
ncbi:DUF547 domain-containing protein [Bizionia gelidisalsuginis]|uniref:DUF547 domain-containing protein n=1 Tax=Bizionia gelidisalsuginis TaxID=291188 RepID=A0ABY3MA09_9FLAO|nr:DUF547 domain-containing protein [Bizionia gelidisalsuginis]TYC12105.1 DUF547 domain-containing protein [Bizionia gelidisalsuginis]